MEERYIASVDLGSSKIALTVARISGNDVQIVYYKETPSDGIRNSYVFNPKKASAPLKEAIAEAEKDLRIKILQVVVGLPKYYVKQESASGKVPRGEEAGCITEEEVENLKEMALESYPLNDEKNEVIYGAVAQSFSTEDSFQQVESDIVGMVSDYLEGNFKVFIGRRRSVANLDVVMNELGIAIARKYFLPDVVAKAVLTEEEMENGVALIDMGAGSTSVTIYKGKVMRHYGAIPFGGKTITSDIRTECGLSERLAENIKLAYGACMPDRLQNLSEKIIQINDENGVPLKQLPVKYLSEIITLREKEIIDSMLYLIEESGFADSLRAGVVITGGGANLLNCASYVTELSGYHVRTGYPRHLFSASGCTGVFETGATAAVGMVLAAKNDRLLNCLDAPILPPEPEPEPAQEPQAEADPVDALFHPGEAEPVETPAAKPEPAEPKLPRENFLIDPVEFGEEVPREPKKKEPKPESRFAKMTKIIWGKVKTTGEELVGSLYDDMDKNNNE